MIKNKKSMAMRTRPRAARLSKEMVVNLTYKTEATWFSSSKVACKQIKVSCEFTWEEPRHWDVLAVVETLNPGAGDVLIVQERAPVKHINRLTWDEIKEDIRNQAELHHLVPSSEIIFINYLVPTNSTEGINPDVAYPLSCYQKQTGNRLPWPLVSYHPSVRIWGGPP